MIKFFTKHIAVLLIVTLLASRLGSLTHEMFIEPIQEHISQVATVFSDDSPKSKTPYILKSKRLLPDVINFEEVELVLTPPSGIEAELISHHVIMPLEVYLDILVPPDEPRYVPC